MNILKILVIVAVTVTGVFLVFFYKGESYLDTLLTEAAEMYEQNNLTEAETAAKEALEITKGKFNEDNDKLVRALTTLGYVYIAQGEKAETLLEQAVKIQESRFGKDHPAVVMLLANIMITYNKHGRSEEAEMYEERLKALQPKP